MTYIYCKTCDSLDCVGNLICVANSVHDTVENGLGVIKKVEDDCWVLETKCNQSLVAMLYRVRNDVVCIEVDDDCAPKVIEPLMEKYGFDNVKWALTK